MDSPKLEIDALKRQLAALTARVYELEQRTGIGPEERTRVTAQSQSEAATPPPAKTAFQAQAAQKSGEGPLVGPATVTHPRTSPLSASPQPRSDLEKTIGQYWLNRIGIVAILVGISYFLKYAFDNNWIGAAGRITIGLVAGIGLIVWGEWFRSRGHRAFSYSLKAVGIGALYLSLWGAFQVYHLIPAAAAFFAMAIVTAATIAMALNEDAEVLASFALIGGFATPVLLSTGSNHEPVLFSYVALLDLAILAIAIAKPWRRLLWGSFAGTIILYCGWSVQYYSRDQRPITVFFAAFFAAIFAAVPLLARYGRSTRFAGPSVTLTFLPLLNAGAFFLALYDMYELEPATLTWYALALAAIYLGISGLFKRRFPEQDTKFINLLHVAIAVAFITIAIPLKLDGQWITIGWLIESATLLWVSVRMRVDFLRYLAVAALSLGIFRLLVFDRFYTQTLVFNARFATYLVAIAVLGGIVGFGKQHATDKEKPFLLLAVIFLNLLALIALTSEASAYFARQLQNSMQARLGYATYFQLQLARDFSYSAIWLVYGAALMAAGFLKRSASLRWQSLVLIAVTIVKVFAFDMSTLDKGYRILSFVALGAVLLAISFIYQRDWLKLSSRSSEERV